MAGRLPRMSTQGRHPNLAVMSMGHAMRAVLMGRRSEWILARVDQKSPGQNLAKTGD